jgi:glycerol-3-phosphate acyltransferase PlsX
LTIALDAMGGDNAPHAIVQGAIEAAPHLHCDVLLVGDAQRIKDLLPANCPPNLFIHPSTQVIEMHEKPLDAIRRKKDSSLVVAVDLVKRGLAQCMVSAGNTGAATAASLLSWRQMHGFHRPAIASEIPSYSGKFLLLDAGASPDVDPEHLVEFALMGRAYAEHVMDKTDPKVHLLNIGEEEGKGNAFAKEAYQHLSKHEWFKGNIEGKDMFSANVDVVVCDAFVGNIVLKTSEGIAELLVRLIREQVPTSFIGKLPYLPMRKAMAPVRKKMDYAEVGGSPLLGLNGLCIICHGRSNAKAIRNALLQGQKALDHKLVQYVECSLKELIV